MPLHKKFKRAFDKGRKKHRNRKKENTLIFSIEKDELIKNANHKFYKNLQRIVKRKYVKPEPNVFMRPFIDRTRKMNKKLHEMLINEENERMAKRIIQT